MLIRMLQLPRHVRDGGVVAVPQLKAAQAENCASVHVRWAFASIDAVRALLNWSPGFLAGQHEAVPDAKPSIR
jgi:hypothetical protein